MKKPMTPITNLNRLNGNILFLSKNNEKMFYHNHKKAKFYLNKKLASWVSKNPPTLKLNFKTKGLGRKGSEYYLNRMENRCAVCGEVNNLHKFHLIPRSIKRLFGDDVERNSHDVLLLCDRHLFQANRVSDNLKKQLNFKDSIEENPELAKVIKLKKKYLLFTSSDTSIPEYVKSEALKELEDFFNLPSNCFGQNCLNLLNSKIRLFQSAKDLELLAYNKSIAANYTKEKISDIFRDRFVGICNPEFLPKNWLTHVK